MLREHKILDTPPEERFDRIVHRAVEQFDVGSALFTLVDHDRHWYKSRIGYIAEESARSLNFCSHVVAIDSPLVIEDAALHETYADNPLVTGPESVSFYAGVPIHASTGEALGTICIIDKQPRKLPWSELEQLKSLGRELEAELAARRNEIETHSNLRH